jgi:hypothetical protein
LTMERMRMTNCRGPGRDRPALWYRRRPTPIRLDPAP